MGQRRRHGASQQHRDHVAGVDREQPRRSCSTRSRTSSSTAGTSSASGRGRSSRSISKRANMSGELWLAEGFTQYYGPLTLQPRRPRRSARRPQRRSPARRQPSCSDPGHARALRGRDEPDGAVHRRRPPIDRTNWSNTYISYYPFGGAIALALDLTLRDRSDGRVTLDDFMRAMWRVHGKPGGSRPGYVDRPVHDRRRRSAAGGGERRSPAFARDFFARYIQGHEVADYARLLRASRASSLRKRVRAAPGSASCSLNRPRRRAASTALARAGHADLRRRPRSGRRNHGAGGPANRGRRTTSRRSCARTSPATPCRS